mmetsp:Transcript_80197/g.227047  ORF Transcript_80197/g.227047 Transcript_80197/m.227047 type:complete len:632 (+) Transcript_80197:68-1963(+)
MGAAAGRVCSTAALLAPGITLAACNSQAAAWGQGALAAAEAAERGAGGRCPADARGAGLSGGLGGLRHSLLQVQHRRSSMPARDAGDGFEAVDGGTDRVCRGADPQDNAESYYILFRSVRDMDTCKALCRETPNCKGVESHADGRCEVWTRAEGIGATSAFSGATCLRHSPPAPSFEDDAVGTDRVCRGADASDNSDAYYVVSSGIASLEACKDRCRRALDCRGVEYWSGGGRCEVWTRPGGIGVTVQLPGFTCLRYGLTGVPASTTATSTTTTTPVVTTTALAVPGTTMGCVCRKSWIMTGFPDRPCENYCCNPDGDPGGYWCFVWDPGCQGQTWGYCAAPPPPMPTTQPPTTQSPPPIDVTEALPMEWEHFNLVNQLRREGYRCPLGSYYPPNYDPMIFECRLWRAAKGHSRDMADRDYFSHTSPDGRSPWDRARAQGISASGENIAASCATPACALEQFKGSDPHCNILMNAGLRMFGGAVGYNSASQWKYYWTQMFTAGEVVGETSCYPSAPVAALVERQPAGQALEPGPPKPLDKGHQGLILPRPWTTQGTLGGSGAGAGPGTGSNVSNESNMPTTGPTLLMPWTHKERSGDHFYMAEVENDRMHASAAARQPGGERESHTRLQSL